MKFVEVKNEAEKRFGSDVSVSYNRWKRRVEISFPVLSLNAFLGFAKFLNVDVDDMEIHGVNSTTGLFCEAELNYVFLDESEV